MENSDFLRFLLLITGSQGGTGTTGGQGANSYRTMMQQMWWIGRLAILGGFSQPHRPTQFGTLNPQPSHAQS